MKNELRHLLKEIIWLIIPAFLSIVLAKLLFDWPEFKESIGVSLNDIYFVLSIWVVLLPLFLLITFVIYFLREKYSSFSRTIPNWVIIISGVTLILLLTFIQKMISDLSGTLGGNWTAYPPLSVVPNSVSPAGKENSFPILIVPQFLILAMVLYAAFKWGEIKGGDEKNETLQTVASSPSKVD